MRALALFFFLAAGLRAEALPTLCDGAIARAVLDYLGAAGGWPWTRSTKAAPAGAFIGSGPPPDLGVDLALLAEATWRGSPELPRTALAPGQPRPGKPVGYFPGPAPAGAVGYVLPASGRAVLDGLADGSLARAELPTPLWRSLSGGSPPVLPGVPAAGAPPGLVASAAAPARFGVWVPRSRASSDRQRWCAALARFDAHPTGDAVLVALGADGFRVPRPGPERARP